MKPLILSLALTLAGCATTSQSGAHYYRAEGSAAPITITGTLTQSIGFAAAENAVSIQINGARVAGGSFSGGSATFSGTHNNRPVIADCAAIAAGSFGHQMMYGFDRTDVKCTVLISGQLAASLLLVPR